MKIAIIGATGLVGSMMIRVLEEQHFSYSELILAASEASVGKEIQVGEKIIRVCSLVDALASRPSIALFSAGSGVSLEWAPRFSEAGCYVVDNSSAWRMHSEIPLIIPEVNIDKLRPFDRIIANPNCSTIQMLVALNPLRKFGLRDIIVTTYQAVSGSGMKGIAQMKGEREKLGHERFYKRAIDLNCIPQCDDFTDNGFTKEEMKLVNETQKIFDHPLLPVNACAVRVPVMTGHSESVIFSLRDMVKKEDLLEALENAPGLILKAADEDFPTALEVEGRDEVFVGRLRQDLFDTHRWNMWVVADNLRKGAASNAVQIATYLAAAFVKE